MQCRRKERNARTAYNSAHTHFFSLYSHIAYQVRINLALITFFQTATVSGSSEKKGSILFDDVSETSIDDLEVCEGIEMKWMRVNGVRVCECVCDGDGDVM